MTEQEQANELQNRIHPIRWHDCSNRELELLLHYGKTKSIQDRAALELEGRNQDALRRKLGM